jgi:hypothetical protein
VIKVKKYLRNGFNVEKSIKHKLFNGLHIHLELPKKIFFFFFFFFYFWIEKKSWLMNIEHHFFFSVSFPTALEHENSRKLMFDETPYLW